ncbi:MAG TPA: undecaprenyl-diphosphate phosphatase [Solirubrobacteraceae bacterium]|jgi:undecaprenyl-diphosphatase|nr:undecaprenyl-diphosphate phosphatase [Solirubrobacteraceae bacterium]
MPQAEEPLPLRHAVALGLIQGPAELLPISSSAHTSLVPWLLGWPYAQLEGKSRKSFEVALHAGAALALAVAMRHELALAARALDRRGAFVLGLSLAPAALVGYVLRGPIERRLGGPGSISAGLTAGAIAMTLADANGQRRGRAEADARDGLALGLAQAAALIPGVSRHGATLTAARSRGFAPAGAEALSWETGLPVILAAVALEARRLRAGAAPGTRPAALAAGGASAFASTLASAEVMRGRRVGGRALAPYAAYRMLLAGVVVLARGRRRRRER